MRPNVRLKVICSLIERADTIADVGCDHALVAKYCADSELCSQVIASDISENCLNKARALVGDNKKVRTVCCDGIAYECDEAVIAGMGGLLICDILQNAYALPKILVLCPHRDTDAVRKKLIELGYGIDKDIPIVDNGKFYWVLRAKKDGGARELSELQTLYGLNVGEKYEALASWLIKQYDTYSVAPEPNAVRLKNIKAALALQGVDL